MIALSFSGHQAEFKPCTEVIEFANPSLNIVISCSSMKGYSEIVVEEVQEENKRQAETMMTRKGLCTMLAPF